MEKRYKIPRAIVRTVVKKYGKFNWKIHANILVYLLLDRPPEQASGIQTWDENQATLNCKVLNLTLK